MGESKRRKQSGIEAAPARGRVVGGFRITARGVTLFLLAMILLDVLFYAVFRFGFDSCYALLCLFD
ncbi:MAG: hypothetical protein R8L07_17160 [Alphaproteobacteria bacterium]|nr:hypothetical protein [Alphaproteobacteria bacterium]